MNAAIYACSTTVRTLAFQLLQMAEWLNQK